MIDRASVQGDAEQAEKLIARYESVAPEEVHEEVLHLIPDGPCRTLDIGAGSGRDAAWLTAKGHTAVGGDARSGDAAASRSAH